MSSRPLFWHALSVPRRVLRPRQCIYTKDVPIIRSNDRKSNRYLTTLSTTSSRSLSVFGGTSSFSASGESSCNPSLRPKIIHNSPTLFKKFDGTSRTFASRRGGQKGGKFKKKSSVVANEALVAQLLRNSGESSADDVTVRLVIDEGPDTPSLIELITLSEAIVLSLDRELDLIGANITSDPPVIRATQLAKLEYKQQQAQKKQKNAASNKKEKKSFRFKAGIESNDLERKLGRLKEFLSKGHDCDFTVFVRLRKLRQDPNAGFELVDQIKELLSDHGDMKRPPQINDTKQFHRVQFEPKK